MHTRYPVDLGAGVAPHGQSLGVVTEVDPDLLEDGLGVVLDDLERLGIEYLEHRNAPGDRRRPARPSYGSVPRDELPCRPPCRTTVRLLHHCRSSTPSPPAGPPILADSRPAGLSTLSSSSPLCTSLRGTKMPRSWLRR